MVLWVSGKCVVPSIQVRITTDSVASSELRIRSRLEPSLGKYRYTVRRYRFVILGSFRFHLLSVANLIGQSLDRIATLRVFTIYTSAFSISISVFPSFISHTDIAMGFKGPGIVPVV